MKHAYILIFALMVSLLATGMYTPAMPEIAREFNTSVVMVQRTLTASFLGGVFAVIVAGLFADHWGRKRTLTIGLFIAVLGNMVMLFSPAISWLIVGRFFQGIGGGAASVIGFAAVQELYPREKAMRIMGSIGTINAIVPAFAPMLGGYVTTLYNWHANFIVSLIIFLVCLLVVHYQLSDELNVRMRSSVKEILHSYKSIASNVPFLAMVLQFPLFFSVAWFQIAFLPFYMQGQIGMTPSQYGIFIGAVTLWFAVGSFLGSRLIERFGFFETLNVGFVLVFIGLGILWLTALMYSHAVAMIALGLSVFRVGAGIIFPGTSTEAGSRFKSARTRAAALRSIFVNVFAFIGSYAAQVMDGIHLTSLAIFASVVGVVGFALYLAFPRTESQ